MAIAKEDIKPGWYWVRDRGLDPELFVVRVTRNDRYLSVERMSEKEWDGLDNFVEDFDFIARIEPPEVV
jgi:hypothetical protein